MGADGGNLPLPMIRPDIADYLGLTIETVSRTMTKLKDDGVIDLVNAREIRFLERAALHALAEG